MGGRRIVPKDEGAIIDDWPEKAPVGRERRKREYQDARAAEAAKKAAERHAPQVPYPGYMTPQAMFPDWDFETNPAGPPLDDPLVKAYTTLQWKAFLKSAR